MDKKCVVVKFHDKEKYAIAVRSGGRYECERYAAYARGLYHELPHICFGVYEEAYYDFCKQQEQKGEGTVYDMLVYDLLPLTNCTTIIRRTEL